MYQETRWVPNALFWGAHIYRNVQNWDNELLRFQFSLKHPKRKPYSTVSLDILFLYILYCSVNGEYCFSKVGPYFEASVNAEAIEGKEYKTKQKKNITVIWLWIVLQL